ncbi:MAG: ribonuclease H-like YkuK family protein [Firmicutes bacterium]|nr:ribonuclease H-like YkuK family protein [Bacillota bacterium]
MRIGLETEGSVARAVYFISPTRGRLSFEQVFQDIIGYVNEDPESTYKIIVGTDSQLAEETSFVTAIIVHRVGKGGRYYYQRERMRVTRSLRQRIFYEASRSLGVASQLAGRLAENGHADLNVEIHLDVGTSGPTKELVREVVGMVAGSGFDARIKPDSFGASKVADKYTR